MISSCECDRSVRDVSREKTSQCLDTVFTPNRQKWTTSLRRSNASRRHRASGAKPCRRRLSAVGRSAGHWSCERTAHRHRGRAGSLQSWVGIARRAITAEKLLWTAARDTPVVDGPWGEGGYGQTFEGSKVQGTPKSKGRIGGGKTKISPR